MASLSTCHLGLLLNLEYNTNDSEMVQIMFLLGYMAMIEDYNTYVSILKCLVPVGCLAYEDMVIHV